jgi:hypothetical protein
MGLTQNPAAFSPVYISSRFLYPSHSHPPTPSQARTARTAGPGNSGVFWGGRVSELLERDVDFEE